MNSSPFYSTGQIRAKVINRRRNATNKSNSSNAKNELLGSIPGLNHILDRKRGLFYNLVWFLIVTASTLSCFYQIYDRFVLYLSNPIDTKITLIRNSSVKFPAITVCPNIDEYISLVQIKWKIAQEKNISSICLVKMTDVINEIENMILVWDLMSVNGTLKSVFALNRALIFKQKGLEYYKPAELVKTFYGTCQTFTFDLVPFKKDDFAIAFLFDGSLPFCNHHSIANYMLHNDEEIATYKMINGYKHVLFANKFMYGITAKQFKVLNRPNKPCNNGKTVNTCEKNCLEAALKQRLHCKLPFVVGNDLPMCASAEDFNGALLSTLEFAVNFNYFENCNCHRKCEEVLYTDNLKMIESNLYPLLTIYFDDNVIETIEEYYSYPFIPFVCDVGGNLGLFLGMCVPIMFQLAESFIVLCFSSVFGK